MKRAKIILTALVLFGIAGGTLAFKAKKFTLNPVYVSTETIFTTVGGGLIFYATTDPFPSYFCSTVPNLYFTTATTNAILVEAYKTTFFPFPRTVTFTIIGGTSTITRLVSHCLSTISLAGTAV
jgi:uncharacterized membrane protein YeiH